MTEDKYHFNEILWTLIYLGLGLSAWIIFKISIENYAPEMESVMIIFGWLILTYFSLIIFKSNKRRLESFRHNNGEDPEHNGKEDLKFIEKYLPTILLSTIKIILFVFYGFYFLRIGTWTILLPILSIILEGIYFYRTIKIIN